jgi:nitrogen regulatory protein PII-like uncharacterized protein
MGLLLIKLILNVTREINMNYRGYSPEREVLINYLKEAKAAFRQVSDRSDEEVLSSADVEIVESIQEQINKLYSKLKYSMPDVEDK